MEKVCALCDAGFPARVSNDRVPVRVVAIDDKPVTNTALLLPRTVVDQIHIWHKEATDAQANSPRDL